MSLEERFEALMKQNEFLASKIQEDSQRNPEAQAQNDYLWKQLGSFLKQKQKLKKETFQSEPRAREQVYSHDVDSSSEEEVLRLARGEQQFKRTPMISELKFLNLKVSSILRSLLIGYIQLKEYLSIRIFMMIRRSS